ncbi:hypothetical protein [Nocardiopsis quinghaiensis]|uniref:hypothetical protein n=1 Tax=Nocardiopsis quinghaiensis TaxID=464995 RepID=UPI00123B7C85|nr:hypothetical protein [Nocardiopsis quinghaiensis]
MTDRPGGGVFAFPEGLTRDGSSIHDAADYTRELQLWARGELQALGKVWGEGDKFAESMEKSLGELSELIDKYMDFLVQAQRDIADYTQETGANYGRAESGNEDIASGIGPTDGTPGDGGRR